MHTEKCLPLSADARQEGKEREVQEVFLHKKANKFGTISQDLLCQAEQK